MDLEGQPAWHHHLLLLSAAAGINTVSTVRSVRVKRLNWNWPSVLAKKKTCLLHGGVTSDWSSDMWSEALVHVVTWHWESVISTLSMLYVCDDWAIVDCVTPSDKHGQHFWVSTKWARPLAVVQSEDASKQYESNIQQPSFMFVSFIPSRCMLVIKR